jgi:hypothetical protein
MRAAGVKRWPRWAAFVVALGVWATPAWAWAQSSNDPIVESGFGFTSSGVEYTVSTSLIGVAVVLVAGVVVGVAVSGGATSTGAAAGAQDEARLEEYLRQNELEVREALALGQGELVDDLCAGLGLAGRECASLGRVLREERGILRGLAEPSALTPERAARFARHLVESMNADPTVAVAIERLR